MCCEALERATSVPSYASSEPVSITVELPDGKIEGETIAKLLSLSNLGKQRILGVNFASNYHASPRFSLEFGTDGYGAGISYVINGERDDGELVESQIEQVVARIRQWYSPVARIDMVGFLLGTLVFAWVAATVVLFVLAVAGKVSDEPSSPRDHSIGQGVALGLVLAVSGLGVLLNRVRKWLFPVGLFALGEEVTRPDKLSRWRWFFGGTVIVGFLLNVVAGRLS